MFENVKKLTKYKWGGEFLNSLKPTQNEIAIPDSTSKNIKKGSMLLFIYVGITFLITVSSVMFVSSAFGYWSNYIGNGWKVRAIMNGLVSAVISGVVIYLIMKYFTGDKKRKPMPYFVLFCLSAVGIAYLVWGVIAGLFMLGYNPLGGLLTIAGTFVSLIGYSDVAVGCIDFCLEANKKAPKIEEKKEN